MQLAAGEIKTIVILHMKQGMVPHRSLRSRIFLDGPNLTYANKCPPSTGMCYHSFPSWNLGNTRGLGDRPTNLRVYHCQPDISTGVRRPALDSETLTRRRRRRPPGLVLAICSAPPLPGLGTAACQSSGFDLDADRDARQVSVSGDEQLLPVLP